MSIQSEERYYLKLKALYYLYEENYSQTEIAQMLGISRVTLKRLLDEAKSEDMVRIQIVDTRGSLKILQMEEQFKKRYGLSDVKIVDCSNSTQKGIVSKLGAAAAMYLVKILRSDMSIGFTWGRTLHSMVEQLPVDKSITNLCAYTLAGLSSENANMQPNIIAEKFIKNFNGTSKILTAPFLCQSASLCSAIKKEPSYSEMLALSPSLDIIMAGIGGKPQPNQDGSGDYSFSPEIIDELVHAKAVGDICGDFFDINGVPCRTSLSDVTVTTPLDIFRQNKNLIVAGGGPQKIESIIGALNGKYINVLITDLETAGAILASPID